MASIKQINGAEDQVLVEEKSFVRILTLNRPRQLNALSFQMVSKLLELFTSYEEDHNVKLVIVKGKGRSFCAGGDVVTVARLVSEGKLVLCDVDGHWSLGATYFGKEFTLNYIMSTHKKPQVSILNGIVMGGGAGVSIHGRFRVATENSDFDRLPDQSTGEYCGLTGARLDGAEMLACGLATHFVSAVRLPLLEEALSKVDMADPAIVSAIIEQFSEHVPLKEESAYNRMDIVDKCFSKRTVEEILSAVEQEGANGVDRWITVAIQSLKKASPMSLKISLRSIREGRLQSIDQCLVREYRMVCHVLRGDFSKDFFEGCRAILLDKDRNPKWEPSKLEMISNEMVDRYFSKVNDKDWVDLKLPLRLSSASANPTATSKL